MSKAFPDDLKQPSTLSGILDFLADRKISVSDTIIQCERTNPNALDQDLIPMALNKKIVTEIRNTKISEIFFTSGFGKNNAFKLFYVDILGLRITPDIKEKREVILDEHFFGRTVKLTVLYSPSGSSNVGLSKSKIYLKNKKAFENSRTPVFDFKVAYYREKLQTKMM